MSVRDIGREEIEALMHQWNGLGEGPLTGMLYEQTKEQVPHALSAAYAANKAAQFVSYGGSPVFESLEGIDEDKASSADPLNGCTEIDSLLYNTVTNGGTDFMPLNYRWILEGVTTSIYRQLASSYRAARKPADQGPQVGAIGSGCCAGPEQVAPRASGNPQVGAKPEGASRIGTYRSARATWLSSQARGTNGSRRSEGPQKRGRETALRS